MTTGPARRRRWTWSRPVAVAGLLTAAARGPAAACGPAAVHPGASAHPTGQPTGTAQPATPPSIPAATLNAMSAGSSVRVTPVTSPQATRAVPDLARSEAAAMHAALVQQSRGSEVLGVTLARVQGAGPDLRQPRLMWLVSVDPFGGAYGSGGPPCGADDFYVAFVDPGSGKWVMAMAGSAPGLRPLPLLGPKPSVAPGTRCEHRPVPVPGGGAAG